MGPPGRGHRPRPRDERRGRDGGPRAARRERPPDPRPRGRGPEAWDPEEWPRSGRRTAPRLQRAPRRGVATAAVGHDDDPVAGVRDRHRAARPAPRHVVTRGGERHRRGRGGGQALIGRQRQEGAVDRQDLTPRVGPVRRGT
jgi:hypothetical protein